MICQTCSDVSILHSMLKETYGIRSRNSEVHLKLKIFETDSCSFGNVWETIRLFEFHVAVLIIDFQ